MFLTDNSFYRIRGDAPAAGASLLAPKSVRTFRDFQRDFLQAKAATVSAQVSTFVQIASSEYEVRLTLSRLNVTI